MAKELDTFENASTDVSEDHEVHAVGKTCGHCGHEFDESDDVRRTSDGSWVHESCPTD